MMPRGLPLSTWEQVGPGMGALWRRHCPPQSQRLRDTWSQRLKRVTETGKERGRAPVAESGRQKKGGRPT